MWAWPGIDASLPAAAAAACVATSHLLLVLLHCVVAIAPIWRGVLGAVLALRAVDGNAIVWVSPAPWPHRRIQRQWVDNDGAAVVRIARPQLGAWDRHAAVRVL